MTLANQGVKAQLARLNAPELSRAQVGTQCRVRSNC